MIETKEFIQRREKFSASLEDNSVAIVYAGVAKKRSADEDFEFIVNRNFYYLTNIKQEGSILVITKKDSVVQEYLFVSEYDEVKEKWTGKRLTAEEAKVLSGVENVFYLNMFESQLDLLLKKNKGEIAGISNVYLDLEPENKLQDNQTTDDVANILTLNYPWIEVKDSYDIISGLRMVKSTAEINEFKEAIAKTNMGIKAIMKKMKPGLYEYQLASLFYYTIQDYDYSPLSFPTIAASGKNATTLHYPTPLGKVGDNELVLFDLGSQHNLYCADISRTIPSTGKFTDLQKTIYQIVLDCNKKILEDIKPGITLRELNALATKYLAEGCLKAKLIENESEIRKYYFHSVSHHIGLDTHDAGDYSLPLVPGNVISDEPGLYFPEYGIGVRIEDDVLVTEEGSYCLSNGIIKEIDDIEKAMASI